MTDTEAAGDPARSERQGVSRRKILGGLAAGMGVAQRPVDFVELIQARLR